MRALFTRSLTLLLACGPVPPAAEPGTTGDESTTSAPAQTTTTPPDPGTTNPTTTAETTAPEPTTGSAFSTSQGFITHPDIIIDDLGCDPWAQDCAPGQKCVPFAEGGGSSWNALKCVDITGDAAPGEPCTASEGGVAGIDDCAFGAYCWDVDTNNHGTCIAQCTGSPDAPVCPAGFHCPIAGDGVLNFCFPTCDPLAQDCTDGEICVSNLDVFICTVDASGDAGQANDPCEFLNACDQGLACINTPNASAACDPNALGCCQPFCELPDAPCPNPDQQCLPWFAPMDEAPPGLESVGICAIPQ